MSARSVQPTAYIGADRELDPAESAGICIRARFTAIDRADHMGALPITAQEIQRSAGD